MFHLSTKQWTFLSSLPTGGSGLAAAVVEDEMIVVVGRNSHTANMYMIQSKTWITIPSMATCRYGCAAVAIRRKVYVFGGQGHQTAEVYDADTKQWASLPNMSCVREGCSAVAVGMRILVIGGHDGTQCLQSTEIYDTETNTWNTLPNLQQQRCYGTAVLVGINEVLVMGGCNSVGQPLDSMERLRLGSLQSGASATPHPALPMVVAGPGDHPVMVPNDRTYPVSPNLPCPPAPEAPKSEQKEWIQKVKSAKLGFEAKVETATGKILLELQKEVDSIDSEIDECKNRLAQLEKKKMARQEEAVQRMEILRREAQIWLDAVHHQVKDVEKRTKKKKTTQTKNSPPSQIVCPITMEVMEDPVMTSDGHTYERSAITSVFSMTLEGSNPKSPATGLELKNLSLTENIAIRSMAREFQEQNKDSG